MPLATGAGAPPFTLDDGEGTPRSLADLTASGPALLMFLKISCPTCQLAMPVVADLERRYGDAIPVVAVTQTEMAKTRPWLDSMGFAGAVLDDESGRYAVSRAFDIQTVPTLVLVDGGRIAGVGQGWDRDRMNDWAADLGARTGRDGSPVTIEGDGRPSFRPG